MKRTKTFSIFDVYPDRTVPCAGGCGGKLVTHFAWPIDGKYYCGDCALKKIEEKEAKPQ